MDMRLEVVVVPVSDVDRAKDLYAGKMGFHVDIDNMVGERMRVVQCSSLCGKPWPAGDCRRGRPRRP